MLSKTFIAINIIALLLALYYHTKNRQSLPLLLYFLLFVVVTENGVLYYMAKEYKNNIYGHQWFSSACAAYYLYVYLDHFKKKAWIKYVWYGWVIWCVYAIGYNVTYQSDVHLHMMPYNVALFFTAALIFKYLYDIIYIDEYREVRHEPLFYFSLGILLFYVCSFPILVFYNDLILGPKIFFYQRLIQVGNVFLSLGYLGAVLCSKQVSHP